MSGKKARQERGKKVPDRILNLELRFEIWGNERIRKVSGKISGKIFDLGFGKRCIVLKKVSGKIWIWIKREKVSN